MMSKRKIVTVLCVSLVSVLCAIRIYAVNHQAWVEKYNAKTVVYENETLVDMPDAYYYIYGKKDLSTYQIRITGTKLVPTETILADNKMTWADLASMGDKSEDEYKKYGYVYFITAQFNNTTWENAEQQDLISLDDLVLVGPDYWVFAATRDINLIPGVNPEMYGADSFGIGREGTVEINIPYLLQGESIDSNQMKHFLKYSPRLLVSSYPDMIYLDLPAPEITR